MNNEEYKEYLTNSIKEMCGDKYIKEAASVTPKDITPVNRYGSDIYNNTSYFYVADKGKRYDVYIYIRNKKLEGGRCNCKTYANNSNCKHIAACLLSYGDQLLPKPPSKEEISEGILKLFKSKAPKKTEKTNNIKEKVNLELELSLGRYTSFKFQIGINKLYILNSENKLRNFMAAYKKQTYEFGKNFTYDPNIHYFQKDDEDLLVFLTSAPRTYYGNDLLTLNTRETELLLDKLKDRKFLLNGYGAINSIKNGLPDTLVLDKNKDKYSLKCNNLKDFYFPSDTDRYLAYNHILHIIDEEERSFLDALKENDIDELVFPKNKLNLFKNGLLNKIKDNLTVSDNVNDIIVATKPDAKIYVDFNRNKINASLKFDYRGNVIDYFQTENGNVLRDEETENQVLQDVLAHNFEMDKTDFVLSDIDDIGAFLETGMDELAQKYQIFTSKKIDSTNFVRKQQVKSTFSIGQNGILSYTFDTGDIKDDDLDGILNSLKNKKKYYRLKSGDLINLEENEELGELNSILQDLNVKFSDFQDNSVEIPKYRAFYIDSLKKNKYGIISTDNSFDKFIDTFKKYKKVKIKFDEFDEQTLRDYQKDGVKWLYTIYKCDLGGILADEMGLGKSIQTISFIKQVLNEKPDAKVMIVCPTALVYNWKKEFDKFGSHLKYVTVAESKAKRLQIINDFDKYNIFITSYGLIRNDNDEYEDKNFELCIIDEAQAIKNYQAGMTKEIKKIKARTKIALTGTPLENSVFELWSIFDFIMPGYLSSITGFRESYGIKDVDEESLERLTKLNYQIKPFILRRKKKEVSKDLPEKIENNIYLELPEEQKKLYMKIVKDTQKEIEELIQTNGYLKARMKILALLTRLRQVVIDPNIIYEDYKGESIKLEKLVEIVKSLKEENHKMLIFSSFRTVVENVSKIFEKEGISHYIIAGDVKSKDRMDLVEKFNSDDTTAFLITLKSGGTGLNLTSADTVIHLDIWWNPQAENQATDRAHRIGQTKNVTVIKLITKGTIEEKILELQEKKKILSDNLIEGKNNSETISSLSEKEMKELLAFDQED